MLTTRGYQKRFPLIIDVTQILIGFFIKQTGATGNTNIQIFPLGPGSIVSFATPAFLRSIVRLKSKIYKGI